MESHKRYCAPCSTNSHMSWDRQCSIFLRRCAEFNESHPENALKYIPMEELWTKVIHPAKLPYSDHFPARYAVGSLSLSNCNLPREAPTRQINNTQRHRTPTRPTGQTSITNFYGPSQSQPRDDNFIADIGGEGEVFNNNTVSPFRFDEKHPMGWS